MFSDIAKRWTEVSILFDKAGKTKDIEFINQASEILMDLSGKEKKAMGLLYSIQ